ncbi:MAG: helix-turn-helix transcriptional regulator [Oscillospiraceae bacterium]|nr:helix-turn-helix transcriptional regulator [Oscillospiraceae bacterium]
MNTARGFRRKREEHGLDQNELSQITGISKAMICYIEKGMRMPSLETVVAVVEALHCPVDELLDREVS